MEILLSAPRGFCAGVVRAIDIVELCIERLGPPIYVRHEIVHNRYVVNALQKKGAIFVEDVKEIPIKQTAIFSAHGVPPEAWEEARIRELNIIDATCPLVSKVHIEALKYAQENYSIIVIGHRGHPEVIGTMGQAPHNSHLVGTAQEAQQLQLEQTERVVALTQTTLSVADTKDIVSILKDRFPNMVARNDICYATTNRQTAVKALASKVNLVLVIGAQYSSNCARLRDVAQSVGVPAYLIDGPEDLQDDWFEGVQKVGITSGASTPETLVEAVIQRLSPIKVSSFEVIHEDVSFVLPKELRTEQRKWARDRQD